ncbi:MAG: hypothetical protein ACYDEE_00305 [Ignavibacteriaceae bacterium]
MKKSFSHFSIIIKILFAIIILTSPINCGTTKRKYYTHPNAYIVDQLAHKKIIMLADFAHGYPLPYKSLIFLLNKWFDKVETGKSKDFDITLILEDDKEIIDNLKQYISTGNWKPVMHYWLPYSNMEMLEFYADIRTLNLKIDSLNARNDLKHRINFDIYGGEPFNVFDNPRLLQLSKEDGAKYFANIRDSVTAQNICAYLDRNKNSKAIIFYGTAHLVNNYVNKNICTTVPCTEINGYYLAYYLKKRFGEDSILSIDQAQISHEMWENSPFVAAKDSNIFVYSDNIPWRDNHPENFDAFIIRRGILVPGHFLSFVFSRNIIEADIKRMSFIEKYLPGALAERYYNEAFESLKLITGEKFKDLSEWKNWFEKSNYDGFKRLNSDDFAKQIFDEFYQNTNNKEVRNQLYKLGIGIGILDINNIPSKDSWKDLVWPEEFNYIKWLNTIGMLWVGTTEEKKEAKEFLVRYTGKNFSVPQDYLKYY